MWEGGISYRQGTKGQGRKEAAVRSVFGSESKRMTVDKRRLDRDTRTITK